jgi:alpha-glucoside transport system permease protein
VHDIIFAIVSAIVGISVIFAIYWLLSRVLNILSPKLSEKLTPFVFMIPAIILLGGISLWPTIDTVLLSFKNIDSTSWVGLKNYKFLVTNQHFLNVLLNNALWVIVVPALSIIIGLIIANLANNLGSKSERTYKSVFFMPTAISFFAAATIWSFIYYYLPQGQHQIGLLNAIWTHFGGRPVAWLSIDKGHLNSLLMMVITVWLNVGFCMVMLSAAIKAVPEETMEAARLDGATERKVFTQVIIPQIKPTIIALFITVLIGVMKIFDIIWALTQGKNNTSVLGVDFYTQYFQNGDIGRGSAIVVIWILLILPFLFYQIRAYKKQRENI